MRFQISRLSHQRSFLMSTACKLVTRSCRPAVSLTKMRNALHNEFHAHRRRVDMLQRPDKAVDSAWDQLAHLMQRTLDRIPDFSWGLSGTQHANLISRSEVTLCAYVIKPKACALIAWSTCIPNLGRQNRFVHLRLN